MKLNIKLVNSRGKIVDISDNEEIYAHFHKGNKLVYRVYFTERGCECNSPLPKLTQTETTRRCSCSCGCDYKLEGYAPDEVICGACLDNCNKGRKQNNEKCPNCGNTKLVKARYANGARWLECEECWSAVKPLNKIAETT